MSEPYLDNNVNQMSPPGGASAGTISPTPIPNASNLNTANGDRTVYHINGDTIKGMLEKIDNEQGVTCTHIEDIKKIMADDAELTWKWKKKAVVVLFVIAIAFFFAAIFANPLFLIGFGITLASGHFVNALEDRMNGAKRANHRGIYDRLNTHSYNLITQRNSVLNAEKLWKENPSSQEVGNFQTYMKKFNHRPLTPERLHSICENFEQHLSIEKHENRLKDLNTSIQDRSTPYWAISQNAAVAGIIQGTINTKHASVQKSEYQLMAQN